VKANVSNIENVLRKLSSILSVYTSATFLQANISSAPNLKLKNSSQHNAVPALKTTFTCFQSDEDLD